MRMPLMIPVLLLAAGTAVAGGRSPGEVCMGAGFRVGTTDFSSCVARVEGDDPLAALLPMAREGRGDAAKPGEADEGSATADPTAVQPHLAAGVRFPGSEPRTAVVGTMVVNGDLVALGAPPPGGSATPAPSAPPPSLAVSAPVQLPGGVTLAPPVMPVITAPNWVWSGGAPQ
jgi:hypothetical protein